MIWIILLVIVLVILWALLPLLAIIVVALIYMFISVSAFEIVMVFVIDNLVWFAIAIPVMHYLVQSDEERGA